MKRVKRRIYSGSVCETEIYYASDGKINSLSRVRFKTAEEREAHRDGISRRNHARLFNENFDPTALYSTLTFDGEHEIYYWEDAKRIRDNYVRRLKYAYPDAVIFVYMGRGKTTARIHMHMVSKGVPAEAIKSKWGYGEIMRTDHLRESNKREIGGRKVDCGQDYSGLANYLYDHWTPEQGGHRWKMTKNARRPEIEPAVEIKREYSEKKPPMPPKGYIYIECTTTPYGYMCFRYVKMEKKNERQRE